MWYLLKNSWRCDPMQKGQGEKVGGDQEIAVMVGQGQKFSLQQFRWIWCWFLVRMHKFTWIVTIKTFATDLPSQPFLGHRTTCISQLFHPGCWFLWDKATQIDLNCHYKFLLLTYHHSHFLATTCVSQLHPGIFALGRTFFYSLAVFEWHSSFAVPATTLLLIFFK